MAFLATSGDPFRVGTPEDFASPAAWAKLDDVRPPYTEFLVDEGNMLRTAELARPEGPCE